MDPSQAELKQILHDRSETVIEGWYRAVQTSVAAVFSPAKARALLTDIWDETVAFLLSEDGSPQEAESIGSSFVALNIRPEAVGRIPQVLVGSVLEDLPPEVQQVLPGRLSRLIAGMVTNLVRTMEQSLLEEQEEIRGAYARSLDRAQEELRIKNAGIEGSINAIMMLNLTGEVTYVNPAFLEMWGYRDDADVLGRHVSRFGEWSGDIDRALVLLSDQGGWAGEAEAIRADGTRFDVHASVSPIQEDGKHTTQLMTFFVDVTEQKRAERALREHAVQAAFLNEIGEEIAGERTREGVLDRAVKLAHETFDLHHVAVLLIDREHDVLEVAAVASRFEEAPSDVSSLPMGEGVTGWVAKNNRTLAVGDVGSDPRYVKLFPIPALTRSEMAVPIRVGGRVIGVLDVQSPLADAFGKSERVVLETLSDQIAVALENARLYRALQDELARRREMDRALRRTVQRLETVHEIDRAILGAKSRKEIAYPLLRRVRRLVPCERASIDLFDFEREEVLILAAVQTVGEGRVAEGASFPLTERALLFEMLGGREVVHVPDIRELPQSSPVIKGLCDDGLRSVLVGAITAQEELIGMLSLGSRRVGWFRPDHEPIVGELADTVGIAIQQARLLDSVRQHRERLRRTMGRLAEVEETERRRVVRELHDRVGQNLTALDLNLSLVRSQLMDQDLSELVSRLDDSLSLVAQTNQRIRQLMIDLRPPVLDDYGLLSALHWYGDRFSTRTGVAVSVRGREGVDRDISAHVENALFRIAQEALNNIAKHAEADQVTVSLSANETSLRLSISDNGCGFDPEASENGRESWGLLTMRERAESVGARCRFESEPGEGTRVLVEIPT